MADEEGDYKIEMTIWVNVYADNGADAKKKAQSYSDWDDWDVIDILSVEREDEDG